MLRYKLFCKLYFILTCVVSLLICISVVAEPDENSKAEKKIPIQPFLFDVGIQAGLFNTTGFFPTTDACFQLVFPRSRWSMRIVTGAGFAHYRGNKTILVDFEEQESLIRLNEIQIPIQWGITFPILNEGERFELGIEGRIGVTCNIMFAGDFTIKEGEITTAYLFPSFDSQEESSDLRFYLGARTDVGIYWTVGPGILHGLLQLNIPLMPQHPAYFNDPIYGGYYLQSFNIPTLRFINVRVVAGYSYAFQLPFPKQEN